MRSGQKWAVEHQNVLFFFPLQSIKNVVITTSAIRKQLGGSFLAITSCKAVFGSGPVDTVNTLFFRIISSRNDDNFQDIGSTGLFLPSYRAFWFDEE